MDKQCDFVFDIVVVRIDAPKQKFDDPNKLSVDAIFNKVKISITASRINVTEFKSGQNVEFKAAPDSVKSNLEECGLPVVLRYSGRTIGDGKLEWPQEIIDQINDDMGELTHTGTCEIFLKGESQGKIEILCRLIKKCKEEEAGGDKDGKSKKTLDRSINPQDILFVVGQSQKCPNPCDPCLDVWEDEPGDEKLNLDLARYRSMDGGRMVDPPPDPFNMAGNRACCELKKMAREYEEIINSITAQVPMPHPSTRPPPAASTAPDAAPMEQSGGPCICFAEQHDGGDGFAGAKLEQFGNANAAPPTSGLPELSIKPIRFCPICLKNMSWLPKFAACPNCGVKPVPALEENLQPKKLTADQILMEYLGKPHDPDADFCPDPCRDQMLKKTEPDKFEQCKDCRCTCKFGKICAHCRIRKLCADIFQSPEKEVDCPKVEPKSSEDFCIVTASSKDCRPYLARVFSELRALYDIKETNKKASEFDEICEMPSGAEKRKEKEKEKQTGKGSEAKLGGGGGKGGTKGGAEHGEHGARKSTQKGKSGDAKGKSKERSVYTPTNRGTKVGHKQCVSRNARVVPRSMGWLWSANKEATKNGWRPGAIRKPIKNLMRFFLQDGSASGNGSGGSSGKKGGDKKHAEAADQKPPVLNVSKQNGEIYVTLRGLHADAKAKPIIFKIVKSPLAGALREMKTVLKDQGFAKCTCHKPVYLCNCRDFMEKRRLTQALGDECAKRGMHNVIDKMVLTDTSESEMEFDVDVTPPAGVAKLPCGAGKPRMISHGTQWKKNDWVDKPKYPIKLDPYWRRYDCAVGDRYLGNAWGDPGQDVFEDGAFGTMGGGPRSKDFPVGNKGAKQREAMGYGKGGPREPRGLSGPGAKGAPAAAVNQAKMQRGEKVRGADGPTGPIPVRMGARYEKQQKEKAEAAKQNDAKANDPKNKQVDMMKYLQSKNAKGGKGGKGGGKAGPVVGPDGLTDAQRKRKQLQEIPPPPLCAIPRRGKAIDPCWYPPCYDPCCYCGPC